MLICPHCQATEDWQSDLARCPQCASVHLVRRLGEVECRDCGAVVPPSPGPGQAEMPAEASPSPGLSEEVAQALDRVLGRSLVSQSAPRTGADSR